MRKQSYKEKLELERAAVIAAGLVSERYSQVSSIEFHMTYYRRGLNQVLMERTLSFSPADYAGFHMKCMHDGCTDGGYDLTPVVAGLVRSGKKSAKGKIYCHGTSDTFGHASIAYEVSIQYHKQVKERPSDSANRKKGKKQSGPAPFAPFSDRQKHLTTRVVCLDH